MAQSGGGWAGALGGVRGGILKISLILSAVSRLWQYVREKIEEAAERGDLPT